MLPGNPDVVVELELVERVVPFVVSMIKLAEVEVFVLLVEDNVVLVLGQVDGVIVFVVVLQ